MVDEASNLLPAVDKKVLYIRTRLYDAALTKSEEPIRNLINTTLVGVHYRGHFLNPIVTQLEQFFSLNKLETCGFFRPVIGFLVKAIFRADREELAKEFLDFYGCLKPIVSKFGTKEDSELMIEWLGLYLIRQQNSRDHAFECLLLIYVRDCGLDTQEIPNDIRQLYQRFYDSSIIRTFSTKALVTYLELVLPNDFSKKVGLFTTFISHLNPQLCDYIMSQGVKILDLPVFCENAEMQKSMQVWQERGGMFFVSEQRVLARVVPKVLDHPCYKPSPKIPFVDKNSVNPTQRVKKWKESFEEKGYLIDRYANTSKTILSMKTWEKTRRPWEEETKKAFQAIKRENREGITILDGTLKLNSTLKNGKIKVVYRNQRNQTLGKIFVYLKEAGWKNFYDLLERALFLGFERLPPRLDSLSYTFDSEGLHFYESYKGKLVRRKIDIWPVLEGDRFSSFRGDIHFFDETIYQQVCEFMERYLPVALSSFHQALAEVFPESGGSPNQLTIQPDAYTQGVGSIYERVMHVYYTTIGQSKNELYEQLKKDERILEMLNPLKAQAEELENRLSLLRGKTSSNSRKVRRTNGQQNASSLESTTLKSNLDDIRSQMNAITAEFARSEGYENGNEISIKGALYILKSSGVVKVQNQSPQSSSSSLH